MKNILLTSSKKYKKMATFIVFGLLNTNFALAESITPEDVHIPDCGSADESTDKVSFDFNDIELKSIVSLISISNNMDIKGSDLLGDAKVTIAADCVDATAFTMGLLLVHGFDLDADENSWVITAN